MRMQIFNCSLCGTVYVVFTLCLRTEKHEGISGWTWRPVAASCPPPPPNSDARLHCERVDDAPVKGWQLIYIRLNSLYFNFKNLWVFVYPKVRNRIKQCVPLEYCQIKSLLLPLMCFNLLGFFPFFSDFFSLLMYLLLWWSTILVIFTLYFIF